MEIGDAIDFLCLSHLSALIYKRKRNIFKYDNIVGPIRLHKIICYTLCVGLKISRSLISKMSKGIYSSNQKLLLIFTIKNESLKCIIMYAYNFRTVVLNLIILFFSLVLS